MQGSIEKSYAHMERLPEDMTEKSFVEVDMKYQASELLKPINLDDMKVEEHENLDDNIYKDNVSQFLIFLKQRQKSLLVDQVLIFLFYF